MEGFGDELEETGTPRAVISRGEGAHITTIIEVQEQTAKTADHAKYDASKISLVAELKRTDSFGKPLSAIPSSAKGRYQPIAAEDKSLKPIGTSNSEENPSTDDMDHVNDPDSSNPAPKDEVSSEQRDGEGAEESPARALSEKRDLFTAKDNLKKPPATGPQTIHKNDPTETAEGGVKRDSLAATVNVVTNLMKWQMKSKMQAGAKLKSVEKYKGHLEVIQRRSRQEQVDVPFPIRLSIRREVLPTIHNIVKEYKLALGHDHKLTQEAMAKEMQLRSELTGDEVCL